MKLTIAGYLRHLEHDVIDIGTDSDTPVDYPDFAEAGKAISDGAAERGVLICGSGVGASVAANKIPESAPAFAMTLFRAPGRRARRHERPRAGRGRDRSRAGARIGE